MLHPRCGTVASCSYSNLGSFKAFHTPEVPGYVKQHQCLSRQTRRAGRQSLHVCSSAQEVVGVLIFSALPFTAVQALADSSLGKSLRENVEKNKPRFEAEAKAKERRQAEARKKSMWFGPDRPKYLGPIDTEYPAYLQGEAPGDYGFDVLKLGASQESFDRYYELELFHARWAMLSALGILVPEVLKYSGLSNFSEPRWQYVGYAKLQGEDLNYFNIPGLRIAGNQGVLIIAVCQVLLMFGPEYARSRGVDALEPLGIYLPGDKNYPGGVFDPLGLSNNPEAFEDLRVKEMKNGRLAMVAWVGFAAQAWVTRKGPVENLIDAWPF